MAQLFADRPDALSGAEALAERLEYTMADLGYRFPQYPVPGGETEIAFLRQTNVEGYFDGLLSLAGHMVEEGFVRREHGAMIWVSSDPNTLIDMLDAYTPGCVEKWIDRAAT